MASWELASPGKLDRRRDEAWIGTLGNVPDSVELHNASSMRGDYALVAGRAEGLLLARGRFAGRCLYYARLPDGSIAACSRIQPLANCLNGGSANLGALGALVLARTSPERSDTVFKEIQRVDAGQVLIIGKSGVLARSEAKFDFESRRGSLDELAEELRAVLARVIERAIQGKDHVAVLVSGGLDSSGVLAHAVAATHGKHQPKVDAVSWSFGGPGDDRPYLLELCRSLRLTATRVSSADASASVVTALTMDATPFIWASGAGILTASNRARALGAQAILTGMGGDEVLAGDLRAIAQKVWSRHGLAAISSLLRIRRNSEAFSLKGIARITLGPLLAEISPGLMRVRRRRYARTRWPWARPLLSEVIDATSVDSRQNETLTKEAQIRSLAQKTFVFYSENRRQLEAATGVEHIDPLLDEEVVTLMASIPNEMLFLGDRQRGLYRHAARHLLPERLLLRRAKGRFEPAIAEMVKSSDLEALTRLANMKMLGDLGLVDPHCYRRCFQDLLAGVRDDWAPMWPPLAVEAFLRSL